MALFEPAVISRRSTPTFFMVSVKPKPSIRTPIEPTIPKNHKNCITLGRTALLATLQRTAILTSDKFKGVRLNIDPGSLRVASNNAEQEEAVDELDIDYGGDSIEIGFNVTYLIDALANMSQDMVKLELSDGNSSALFTIPDNATFKYVVMPMRI